MQKLVKRYDYESSVSAQLETTPEGFLKVRARATRVGVLKYIGPDGKILRELRHPDQVFDADSMASLALKPFTNKHPPGLIDSETASMYQVGMTGEVVNVEDGKFLNVMCVITDAQAIKDALSEKHVEVSPGYTCQLDFTPGIYNGEEYDAIQKNIRYNHLAQVKKGRSGPEVRLCLDSDDAMQVGLNQQKESKKMKIKLKDKDYEVDDAVGKAMQEEMDAFEKMKNDAAGGKAELEKVAAEKKKADKDKEKAEAKADGLEAELAKLKSERHDSAPSKEVLRAAVKARLSIDKVAEVAGVEKFDAMDDLELKKAVILAHQPEAKLDGKSEDYIEARFDLAAESINGSEDRAKNLGKKITDDKRTEVLDSDDARQKMIERNRSQWKTKAE